MSDNIEVVGTDAAFVSLRQPAWHFLGTVAPEPLCREDMMAFSFTSNWDVRTVNIADRFPELSFHLPPYLTVRDNPFPANAGLGLIDVLGVVKGRYAPYQNESLFQLGDNLIPGLTWETMGSIKNGTIVFGSKSIDAAEFTLDAAGIADVTKVYLLLYTSHDGTMPITVMTTPVRVVCSNTLAMAISGVKRSYRVRHTDTAGPRLAPARDAIGLAVKYSEALALEAAELLAIPVPKTDQFLKIIETLYPIKDKDSKAAGTRHDNKVEQLLGIWSGPTNKTIQNTAWGVLNALTERLDWGRTARGGDKESLYAAASGFDPVVNAEKDRIHAAVRAMFVPKASKAKAVPVTVSA